MNFQEEYAKHGDSYRSLGWGSPQSVRVRYGDLLKRVNLRGKKVLDVGCGLGHLYDYCLGSAVLPECWHGYDSIRGFVERCREKYKNDRRSLWCKVDIGTPDFSPQVNYFDAAIYMGTLSTIPKLEFSRCIDKVREINARVTMIELLRDGVNRSDLVSYSIREVEEVLSKSRVKYRITFHELPNVFNVYIFSKDRFLGEVDQKW